jgi:hypothetical protein
MRSRLLVPTFITTVALAAGFASLVPATGVGQASDLIARERLTLVGVVAEPATYLGRPAMKLLESDKSRNNLGLAIVNGVTLRNGTIAVDVAGRRGQYAVPDDRGFIGLAFRVSPNAERFEYIYLRPDNGRVNDQVRRNHSTQYSAHPDFPFSRMRKEFPEKYESYVDLEYGAWTRMRIDVEGTTARLFVHEALQPALVVTDLKLGDSTGGVALWIGSGTEGFFSNLRVTPR